MCALQFTCNSCWVNICNIINESFSQQRPFFIRGRKYPTNSLIGGREMSSQGQGQGQGQTQDIATLIRNWVHYDNLASTLSKQSTNARKMKSTYEDQIISSLRRSHMENAVIKVSGGQITMAHEKATAALTLGRIEELTQKYFALRGGMDETEAYMRFLRKNRGTEDVVRLKKTLSAPPVQGPFGTINN